MYTPLLGREIDANKEVVVTVGANEGILSAIAAFVRPGDEVLAFDPFYDQFMNNVTLIGGKVVPVPMLPPCLDHGHCFSAQDWRIDFDRLERSRTDKTRMLILNSPHNPLGKVFGKQELESLGEFCVKHNILILSDEVYEHLSYTGMTRMSSISPEISRLTLTVSSAGKSFFMTGWRVGWVIGPQQLIKHVVRAHIAICYSGVSPFQEAVADALNSTEAVPFWKQSNLEMRDRMERFTAVWDELGLPYYKPAAGYFVVVDMSSVRVPTKHEPPARYGELSLDCKIVWFLATVIGVGAIPGATFRCESSTRLSKGAVRFSYAKDMDELDLAKARLRGLRDYV